MTPLLTALTPQEERVLQLIAMGWGMREIAGRLHMAEATARWHRMNILRKLDARNQAHAVAIYAGLAVEAAS